MFLISCHLDILARSSAHLKFGGFLKFWNFFEEMSEFSKIAPTSIELRISSRRPNGMELEASESSLSIYFVSWKRYSGRPIWPEKFSWKLRNLKIYRKIRKNQRIFKFGKWSPNSDFQSKMSILRKYIKKPFECF